MRRHRFLLLIFLLFLWALWACQPSGEEQIRQTLNQRGEALKKKDLSLYLSCISNDYQDREGDRTQLQKRMEGYFKTFDRIDFDYWDRSIQIEGETATVIQQFHLEIEREGKTNRFSAKEAFLLRKEGGRWKIFKGI
jgi:ketosteroid isomerase-like protein